jgi:hypothetical protein
MIHSFIPTQLVLEIIHPSILVDQEVLKVGYLSKIPRLRSSHSIPKDGMVCAASMDSSYCSGLQVRTRQPKSAPAGFYQRLARRSSRHYGQQTIAFRAELEL